MQRTCEFCHSHYSHEPVTAVGPDSRGVRQFILACSFGCLVAALIDIHSLEFESAPTGVTFPEPVEHAACRLNGR